MGTVANRSLRVAGNWFTSGGMEQYTTEEYKNAAGQVFKAGELVTINATPEVIRFASIVGAGNDKLDVSLIQGAANRLLKIYGIALKDAPASGQITIPVARFIPGTLVEGNLVDGSDGDAPTNHTLVAGDKGLAVGLLFDDTNDRWYFTVQAAEKCAEVQKIGLGVGGGGTQDPLGAIGDVNARVQCLINPDMIRMHSESA